MGIDGREYTCEDCNQSFVNYDFCPNCGSHLVDEGTGERAEDEK